MKWIVRSVLLLLGPYAVLLRDDVLVRDRSTSDERHTAAGLCVRNLGIGLPAVVDGPDNAVERDYTGWPDRLYLVDRRGRIAYKSAAGPFGFTPADLQAAIVRELGEAPPLADRPATGDATTSGGLR